MVVTGDGGAVVDLETEAAVVISIAPSTLWAPWVG